MNLYILGRQPELSLAELKSLLGEDEVWLVAPHIAASRSNFPDHFRYSYLGGTVKIAEALIENLKNPAQEIEKLLPKTGKVTLGLSSETLTPKELQRLAIQIKSSRGSVRIIPNQTSMLSSAVTLQNNLYKGGNKLEFIIEKNFLARVTFVQNLTSYTVRDRQKPHRDARNGMLPPKLAQIMLNLANPQSNTTILDPFCGSGTILMEAALRQNLNLYGTDLNESMINHTETNLSWLVEKYHLQPLNIALEIADATNHKWHDSIDTVVSETYLGQPYTSPPTLSTLRQNIQNVDLIVTKFLKNLRPQITKKTKIVLAIPRWYINNRAYSLPLVKNLRELGYQNQIENLVYRRESQIVARQILVLQKLV